MERTATLIRGRAFLGLLVWAVSATVLVFATLQVVTAAKVGREVELAEQLLQTSVQRLNQVTRWVGEVLGEEGLPLSVTLPAASASVAGFVVVDEAGGVRAWWPKELQKLAEEVRSEVGGRDLAVLGRGEWAGKGVLAGGLPLARGRAFLLLEWPRLLLESGWPGTGGAVVVWMAIPGQGRWEFACEARAIDDGGWLCIPFAPESPSAGEESWEGRKELGRGLSLGRQVRLAGQTLSLGLFLPREPANSPGLAGAYLLLLWVLVVAGTVVAWRYAKGMEAHLAANQLTLARQEAEQTARVAEAQWRLLLEGVKEPLLFLRGGLVARANQAAAKLLGFEYRGDVIGRSFADLVAPEERDRVQKLLSSAASPSSFTTHLQDARGRRRTVDVSPWAVEVGNEAFVALSLADFTARERLEQSLRAVLSSVNVGVACLDPKGAVVWSNRTLSEALGLRAKDLQGSSLLPFVVPGDRRAVQRAFVKAIRLGRSSVVAGCKLRGDSVRSVEVVFSTFPVAGVQGGVVVSVQPVGPWAHGAPPEEVLVPLHELVVHTLHRAANLVQAPLTSPPTGRGAAAKLQQALVQVADLMHRLSLFVREYGAGLAPLDCNGLLAKAEQTIGPSLPANVRLLIRPWSNPAVIAGDAEQLVAFLEEAVGISVECLRGGAGSVELSVERLPGGTVRLAVSDTGEVFAGADQPLKVLSPRLRSRGLAFLVARRHLGEAGFRERAGFGARVWVDFPAAALDAHPVVVAPRTGKILVVDDEAAVREGLALVLQQQGYEVLQAANGREALAVYDAQPRQVALVVLDLVMPEMDGREVYRELMQRPFPPVVLLCTGYDPGSDPLLASAHVLVKPFTADAFLQTVQRFVKPPEPAPPASL
ncbi:MAG: PAS domain S-box protein [Thermoanaerobaculum sp.]|nr:PAS domain S-box protein [Thermoanaerobaculum sp.]